MGNLIIKYYNSIFSVGPTEAPQLFFHWYMAGTCANYLTKLHPLKAHRLLRVEFTVHEKFIMRNFNLSELLWDIQCTRRSQGTIFWFSLSPKAEVVDATWGYTHANQDAVNRWTWRKPKLRKMKFLSNFRNLSKLVHTDARWARRFHTECAWHMPLINVCQSLRRKVKRNPDLSRVLHESSGWCAKMLFLVILAPLLDTSATEVDHVINIWETKSGIFVPAALRLGSHPGQRYSRRTERFFEVFS